MVCVELNKKTWS